MSFPTIRETTQKALYKAQRDLKHSLGHAETRNGVRQEELDNIRRKLDIVDYLITLVNKEDCVCAN